MYHDEQLIKHLNEVVKDLHRENDELHKKILDFEIENKQLRQEIILLESLLYQRSSVKKTSCKTVNIYLG